MSFVSVASVITSCFLLTAPVETCVREYLTQPAARPLTAGTTFSVRRPVFTGTALDVELLAQAALVWDFETGEILYERASQERRPVASLSKLLSALVIRDIAMTDRTVGIPGEVRAIQQRGAHIGLPVGEHVSAEELLRAAMVASANDAMAALAISLAGSEEVFSNMANDFAATHGLINTKVSNATGLSGGEQYSTAADIKELFSLAYRDTLLKGMLVSQKGVLVTQEGSRRSYETTNELLGTYFPILAAKTGYTSEAGENLVVLTYGAEGQRIGAVVLGSEARFQDMKTLVEWIWRNYTWQQASPR